jgi:PhzF family phenazine biosynthesis protein
MRPLFIVDAFSSRPFSGNPAGVCLLTEDEPDDWKQDLAAEVNLAETAFVVRDGSEYRIRWFTPKCEVELCGHATLASAHVLWQEKWVEPDQSITFQSQSGPLVCRKIGKTTGDGNDLVELDFPLQHATPTAPPIGMQKALGLLSPPLATLQNNMDFLVHIDSADDLRNMRPDFELLSKLQSRGWIVTCQSDSPDFDFLSRFFGPSVGIDEDPVTGSAHCCLVSYWAAILHRTNMTAYQASKRGGVVSVDIRNDRAILSGHATTVIWGKCKGPRSGAVT